VLALQRRENLVLGIQHKQIRASPRQLRNQRAESFSRRYPDADDAVPLNLLDTLNASTLDMRP